MSEAGSSLMDIDFNKEKESPNEGKAIENVALDEGQILLRDNALEFETINNNGNDVAAYGLQVQGVLQVQQQVKPKENAVCWESLLNVKSVRVLLVENDDSTRHIISALLRNCNYEVVEAANGLQAWMILEDLANHIDLVLTEVVMPCVSGISLLCKITSHKTRKNVPVIMMSFRDSMSIVFKCLSKGAAGFLIKPIRKNELKNLWQHIWRRSHNSCGSGGRSGKKTRKSMRSKGRNDFNNVGSYDGANNKINGLDIGDGSVDCSDAQSSWTKQAIEFGSSESHVVNSCVRTASLPKVPAQMLKPLTTECC